MNEVNKVNEVNIHFIHLIHLIHPSYTAKLSPQAQVLLALGLLK